ncbi:MAG: flagellin [Alphaproteobacteria bacterium]|nr:flagellin [Alphaproteobacteria bacterium]
MSSLLTNESSMIALTTLRSINKDLGMVQQQISTGKTVSSARDNAAIWAVATVMQTDVDGFDAISTSLSLGAATVGVARGASEQITSLLQDMKTLIVAAQEENVDRSKIQTDITQLNEQITTIVDAAQFNGLNLLKGTDSIDILASLNRAADGTVSASNITIARSDLSITGGTVTPPTGTITAAGTMADGSGTPTTLDVTVAGTITTGEVFTVNDGTNDYTYTAVDSDTATTVAAGLAAAVGTNITDVVVTLAAGVMTFTNSGATPVTLANTVTGVSDSGLAAVASIDVTTSAGADSALTAIEGLIQVGIDAAAAFGSSQKRIDIQNEFVTTLTDSMKLGIGVLTETNMEEASARLQSLQVQQQLGIQVLSIANQGPQALLGLFR